MRTKFSSRGFTLVELLVVIAIIGILIGMLLPAVQAVREAARRMDCSNKMRQMSLGMVNYESAHQNFPPGVKGNGLGAGFPGLNWGSFILPFLEQNTIHDILSEQSNNFSNPNWADTENGDTAIIVLPIFLCPSDDSDERNRNRFSSPQALVGGAFGTFHARSNYIGVLGPRLKDDFSRVDDFDDISFTESGPIGDLFTLKLPGILFLNSEVTFAEISDGASNTFVIGERDSAEIPGSTNPRSAGVWCASLFAQSLHPCLGPTSDDPEFTINSIIPTRFARQQPFASQHPGGANFGRADGSVEFVAETISGTLYRAMGTKAGGEVLVEN